MKRIIISVTNDLLSDNRVHKVATSLINNGFDVILIGRRFSDSQNINRKYKIKRFKLIFNKNALFYAEYNLRLFIFLLFTKADIFLSNDLDTLLANFIASKLRKKRLIYDSHELFTQVPELIEKPKIQNFWLKIEKFILPKIKYAYTVCDSLANYYYKKYGLQMKVVRNVPKQIKCEEFRLKKDKKVVIYQGSVNFARGLEDIISAMQYLEKVELWIVGNGDIIDELKKLVEKLKLENRVIFHGRVKFEDLCKYTKNADLGISIEKNVGLNYYYSLPNKIFDYIHAEIPILCSDFPEMIKIIKKYNVGTVLKTRIDREIASQIEEIFSNKEQYQKWKKNL
ncbi:MAG: glycosyltransferase, partial [Bacteroidota bacterium]|nr:glycosyltransferase [Bacteroidota bacterium]